MTTATPQPDLPLGPDDANLLDAFLLARFDLHALVERFQLTAAQLLEWASSPAIQDRLRRLQEFADQCFHLRASTARANAADALDRVAAGRDPVESRRAAAALIRIRRPGVTAKPTDAPTPGAAKPSGATTAEALGPPEPPPEALLSFPMLHALPDPSASLAQALAAAAGAPLPLRPVPPPIPFGRSPPAPAPPTYAPPRSA